MCLTAHVHIPVHTPVALAPPMQQLNALYRQVTITHPLISLIAHTGDDIEQVIPVTTTLLRGGSIKLKPSNVGHFCEKQDQCLCGHKSYH